MGTHPMFESDFDCLTEVCINGKVRAISVDGSTPRTSPIT